MLCGARAASRRAGKPPTQVPTQTVMCRCRRQGRLKFLIFYHVRATLPGDRRLDRQVSAVYVREFLDFLPSHFKSGAHVYM